MMKTEESAGVIEGAGGRRHHHYHEELYPQQQYSKHSGGSPQQQHQENIGNNQSLYYKKSQKISGRMFREIFDFDENDRNRKDLKRDYKALEADHKQSNSNIS